MKAVEGQLAVLIEEILEANDARESLRCMSSPIGVGYIPPSEAANDALFSGSAYGGSQPLARQLSVFFAFYAKYCAKSA